MYRILIVEDDPMVALIHEQYIGKNKNFRVIGKCRDGWEALDFLEEHEADLLILDVYMPRMDGFETLRQIRSRKLSAEVIMVTAANDRESLEEALHLGAIDYLVKPFTDSRLQVALEKFISQHTAIRTFETLNQKNIDRIVDTVYRKSENPFPKDIQEKTLEMLLTYLKQGGQRWMTGDEIAGEIGLTGVTVRRYMHYLAGMGEVIGKMNYDTGGRPCMVYRIVDAT